MGNTDRRMMSFATDNFTSTGGESHNFEDSKEECVQDSVLTHDSTDGTNQHREDISQSPSPLEEILNVDLGKVSTSSAYFPPRDVLCEDRTYSEIATNQAARPLSIEIAQRACETIYLDKLKSLFALKNVQIDGLEFGARPVTMSDSPYAPKTHGLKRTTNGSPGEESRRHSQRVKSRKARKSRKLSASVEERGSVIQKQPVQKELHHARERNQAMYKHSVDSLPSPRVESRQIRKSRKPSVSIEEHEMQKTRERNQAMYKRSFDSLPFYLRD